MKQILIILGLLLALTNSFETYRSLQTEETTPSESEETSVSEFSSESQESTEDSEEDEPDGQRILKELEEKEILKKITDIPQKTYSKIKEVIQKDQKKEKKNSENTYKNKWEKMQEYWGKQNKDRKYPEKKWRKEKLSDHFGYEEEEYPGGPAYHGEGQNGWNHRKGQGKGKHGCKCRKQLKEVCNACREDPKSEKCTLDHVEGDRCVKFACMMAKKKGMEFSRCKGMDFSDFDWRQKGNYGGN